MKKEIVDLLSKEVQLDKKQILSLIEVPPDPEMGDYAFPCFVLAGKLKKNPAEIAKDIAKIIVNQIHKKTAKSRQITGIQVAGPYINFFINKKNLVESVVERILKEKENYGCGKEKCKILVEFPSPNTNKPHHLGHLRNVAIGESISRTLEMAGNKVIRVNLFNDRGIHITKSMLAYKKYGRGKTPESAGRKPDFFVGDFYVLYSEKVKEHPELEEENKELLRKWEFRDPETIRLWKKMNNWAYKGFKETYRLFGVKHDKNYYESETYEKGRKLIEKGLKQGRFYKKEGAVVVDLSKKGLGEKVLIRSDGTTVYITQDVALANEKNKDFHPDKSIIVTGSEQIYHFKVLFEVLKILGFKFLNQHLAYGMVNLPEGKMKSREGRVIDADDFILEIKSMIEKELRKRYKLSEKELNSRSLKIALAAIKYYLLRIGIIKDIVFNPEQSISFEGETGPYLQYSYARASSILRKAGRNKEISSNLGRTKSDLKKEEIELIKFLGGFPDIINKAAKKLDPSLVANYTYQLAKLFNEFYHCCPVINSEEAAFRLALVKAFRYVMKKCLWLLGIDAIEEM